jgi:hypothetical protein
MAMPAALILARLEQALPALRLRYQTANLFWWIPLPKGTLGLRWQAPLWRRLRSRRVTASLAG